MKPKEFENFAGTFFWQEVLKELAIWEKSIFNELGAPTFNIAQGKMDFNTSERALYDEGLRGSLRAIERFRQLPIILKELAEQEETKEE